jgi:hypothetical protein
MNNTGWAKKLARTQDIGWPKYAKFGKITVVLSGNRNFLRKLQYPGYRTSLTPSP